MRFIIIVFVLTSFSGCDMRSEIKAPEKVIGIPDKAFWVGGPDGGNWYLIDSIDVNAETAAIRIYNDQSGELEISKVYTLHCDSGKGINWQNLRDEISGYDGTIIILRTVDRNHKYCFFE